MWLCCIVRHICEMIYSFTSLLRPLLHLCMYLCVRGESESRAWGRWSGAADLCISVTIDRAYWQPSLLIKSQPSIRELTVLLLTHFGASACREGMQRGARAPHTLWETVPAAESDRIHEGIMAVCVFVSTHCGVFSHWPLMLNKF